jgi:dTDP-glucose 4,6-dehydratase
MRVLITGGCGFLGSHLAEKLLGRGDTVISIDDLSTGRLENIEAFSRHPNFVFIHGDVSTAVDVQGPIDAVAHLASPASPPDYHRLPLETLAVGSRGTENALALAEENSARFVLASTSEVYGDPTVHPQTED